MKMFPNPFQTTEKIEKVAMPEAKKEFAYPE